MHYPVVEFDAIDSTNSEAQRRAVLGERGPMWFRADRQLAGRGRSGRDWSSPSGNLSATLLITPGCAVANLHQLSLVVGIAACDTIRGFITRAGSTAVCRIKWPNDLMIARAKTGGILVESTVYDHDTVAIIGCGINIPVAPSVDGRAVTSLAEHGANPAAADFLESFDREIARWLSVWDRGLGFAAVRQAWIERGFPSGEPMSINTNAGTESGTFAGLDADGALLLRQSAGSVRRFHFGDVALGGAAASTGKTETETS